MARLDEIGLGIATVLGSSSVPEPLFVDLRGHTPVEALVMVRSVIDACLRSATPIALVRMGERLGARFGGSHFDVKTYEGVPIELDAMLGERIEFYRFPLGA